MKVLVTGGAGYIGSVVAERLVAEGHDIIVLDNLERGHREAVPPEAEFIEADLRDAKGLVRALGTRRFEMVMHLAASSLVGESMEDPGKYFANNLGGGVNLLDLSIAAGATGFVFSSSAATYGDPETVPILESAPTAPTNPYGESKLLFERILSWYSRLKGLRFISLRYFNAAGATATRGEDHEPETHLIPRILRAAQEGSVVEIFGDDYPTADGTCVRDYIHIVDLAEAHLAAMRAIDRGIEGIYNLGNGAGFSVKEVVAIAQEVTGRTIRTKIAPRRPGDPPALVASSERARRELEWNPSRESLRQIVASAWAWHNVHPRGYARTARH